MTREELAEAKTEALEMLRRSVPQREVAKAVGVSQTTIHRWVSLAGMLPAPTSIDHGTLGRYVNEGCRCGNCVLGWRLYRKRLRRRQRGRGPSRS